MGKPGKGRSVFRLLFRAFFTACLMAITYWVAWFLVMNNLWSNSVYYAKNMPHKEGTDPVLALLVENLEWNNPPEIKGLMYEYQGYNFIKSDGPGDDIYLSGGLDFKYTDANNVIYSFDKSFKITKAFDYEKFNKGQPYKINKNDVDINKIKKEIYEFVDPLVKLYDVEPWINLQWIFNWYYHDRFN